MYLACQISGYGAKVASFEKSLALDDGEERSTLSSFQALADFLLSLTNKDGDGRIIISRTKPTCSGQQGGYIKYVMLTGEKIFSEVCLYFLCFTWLDFIAWYYPSYEI